MRQRDTLKVALIYPPEAGEEVMAKAADWQYGLGEAVLEKGKIYREILDFTYSRIACEALQCGKKVSGKRVQTFTHEERPIHPILSPKRAEDIRRANVVVAVDPRPRLASYISDVVLRGQQSRALVIWTSSQVHESVDRLLSLQQTMLISKNPLDQEREGLRRAYGFFLDPEENETDWKISAYKPTMQAVRYPFVDGEKHNKNTMFDLRYMNNGDPESQPNFRQFLVEPETDAKDLAEKKEWVAAKIKQLGLE